MWEYHGDENVEYGGLFVKCDYSDFKYGYLECIRVTDLDSACGFTNAVLIEAITVVKDRKRLRKAVESCGITPAQSRQAYRTGGRKAYMMLCADALASYGHYDPSQQPAYVWGDRPHIEIILTKPGKMKFEGWKASKVVQAKDLKGYILKKWCD